MLTPNVEAGQASGLRRMGTPGLVRSICITSGKGGVGKTHVAANLGIALTRLGKEVMVLDADLGMANIDVVLGLRAHYNLSHVLTGEQRLKDIVLQGPGGLRVIPAGSGVKHMLNLSPAKQAGIINAFSEVSEGVDYLVVDTPAGMSRVVATFCRAAHDVVVVVCDEPSSITDAYAVIKRLSRDYDIDRFQILTNRVVSILHGRQVYAKLNSVASRFLDVRLEFFGAVPEDPKLRYAVQSQQAVVEAFPECRASAGFKRLAGQVGRWAEPQRISGHLQFFLEYAVGGEDYNRETRP